MSPMLLMPLYALCGVVSAFFLFLVQPAIARIALPTLGGAPFVWNGCMVFFQALLLAGYAYAHGLSRLAMPPRQRLLHVGLLSAALLWWPLSVINPAVDAATQPALWLIAMLTLSVGVFFFCLSATAPLIQYWFAHSGHPRAHNPYTLYAASNFGSFLALLAYPFAIEPWLTQQAQMALLSGLYVVQVVLFALIAWGTPSLIMEAPPLERPGIKRLLAWLWLAAVPSSLLYGVTAYVTTDIASIPLLWIVPLTLYLLSFIVAFSERFSRVREYCSARHAILIPVIVLCTVCMPAMPLWFLPVHWLVFFGVAISCHSRLAGLKPLATQLTTYYMALALGGVLGGVFNTFLAPHLFSDIAEYPLALVASLTCLPAVASVPRRSLLQFVATGTLAAAFCFALVQHQEWLGEMLPLSPTMLRKIMASVMVVALLVGSITAVAKFRRDRRAYTMSIALLAAAAHFGFSGLHGQRYEETQRNYFGTSRVVWHADQQAFSLRHGRTTHGTQSTLPGQRLKITAYYTPLNTPFALARSNPRTSSVAAIGMGLGTLACHGRARQQVDFYEIDPLVVAFAQDARYFTYLRDCPPVLNITLGDGRLNLAKARDASYALIVVDAFSSDAIPAHLLTQEAVAMYRRKLDAEGLILFHISNNHVALAPVVAAIADALGLHGAHLVHVPEKSGLVLASEWVALSPSAAAIGHLRRAKDFSWGPMEPSDARYLWRDEYYNLLRSLKW